MTDIGPGPLICIKSTACSCGENVQEGRMYQCIGLHKLPSILQILWACPCGEEHLWVHLQDKEHIWCPSLFGPLGDPDAVIKETDEPSDAKRREDEGYGTNPAMPDIRKIKETQDV